MKRQQLCPRHNQVHINISLFAHTAYFIIVTLRRLCIYFFTGIHSPSSGSTFVSALLGAEVREDISSINISMQVQAEPAQAVRPELIRRSWICSSMCHIQTKWHFFAKNFAQLMSRLSWYARAHPDIRWPYQALDWAYPATLWAYPASTVLIWASQEVICPRQTFTLSLSSPRAEFAQAQLMRPPPELI